MATQDEKRASDLSEQAIALAEQLGRIAGTIEGTAESWVRRDKLADQLARVRDSASQMLDGLTAQAERGRNAAVSAVEQGKNAAVSAAERGKNAAVSAAERGKTAAVSAVDKVRPMPAKAAAGATPKMAKRASTAATLQSDPSRAPGKKRRKPGPTMHGVKKSDESIPKMRTAAAARQRRKSYA